MVRPIQLNKLNFQNKPVDNVTTATGHQPSNESNNKGLPRTAHGTDSGDTNQTSQDGSYKYGYIQLPLSKQKAVNHSQDTSSNGTVQRHYS